MPYTLFEDHFGRADSGDLGAVWDVQAGGPSAYGITGNTATPTNFSLDCVENYNGLNFPADQWAQGRVAVVGGTVSDQGLGVTLRASTAAYTLYFANVCDVASNNLVIGRVNAATFTVLVARTQPWTDGAMLRLEIVGLRLALFVNGAEALTFIDSGGSVITSGRVGLMYSSTCTSGNVTAFSAGSMERRYYNMSSGRNRQARSFA